MSDTAPTPAPAAPAAPAPAASKAASGTVRLHVTAPPYVHAFTSGDVTVTREGSDVPADAVDDLKKTADKHGVTVAEVSE